MSISQISQGLVSKHTQPPPPPPLPCSCIREVQFMQETNTSFTLSPKAQKITFSGRQVLNGKTEKFDHSFKVASANGD